MICYRMKPAKFVSTARLDGRSSGDDFDELASDDGLTRAVELHRELVDHFTLKSVLLASMHIVGDCHSREPRRKSPTC